MQRYTPAYAALIRNDEVKQGELTGSLRRASDTVISSQARWKHREGSETIRKE